MKPVTTLLEERLQRVEGRSEDQYWFVSHAKAMERIQQQLVSLRRITMRGDLHEPHVTIIGEDGAGQEGLARMIHVSSRRGKGPWIHVNCVKHSPSDLESALFGNGNVTGALELAHGGTLFLSHFEKLNERLQDRMVQALRSGVDVRVIVSAGLEYESNVRDGLFKKELHALLKEFEFQVPPLRERKEDIVTMAKEFAEKAFKEHGKVFSGFQPDAEEALRHYAWPGNVHELFHEMERVALLAHSSVAVGAELLKLSTSSSGQSQSVPQVSFSSTSMSSSGIADQSYTAIKRQWSDNFERDYLNHLLNEMGGNVSAAARKAKLDRSNFLRLLRKHGIRAQVFRSAA